MPPLNRFPAESRLDKRPRLLDYVVAGEEGPILGGGAQKESASGGMKRVLGVEGGVKAGGIDEDGFHRRVSLYARS